MRPHLSISNFLFVLLILYVGLVILLSRVALNFTPEQVVWLSSHLAGQGKPYDQTITLSGKIKLSTLSGSYQYKVFMQPAKQVEADLAFFDIRLAEQTLSYPDNLDFPSEDKPRHIVIRLVDEPQPWYSLYDEAKDMEIGSLNTTANGGIVEVSIYVNPQYLTSGTQLTSQFVNQFALYGLYALTHAWPSDSAQMMSHVNEQIVNYYGHGQHEPTFYVK